MTTELKNIYALSRIRFFLHWKGRVVSMAVCYLLAFIPVLFGSYDYEVWSLGNVSVNMSISYSLIYTGITWVSFICGNHNTKEYTGAGTSTNKFLGEFFGDFAWFLLFAAVYLVIGLLGDVHIALMARNGGIALNAFEPEVRGIVLLSLLAFYLGLYSLGMVFVTIFRLFRVWGIIPIIALCVAGNAGGYKYIADYFDRYYSGGIVMSIVQDKSFIIGCFIVFAVLFIICLLLTALCDKWEMESSDKETASAVISVIIIMTSFFIMGFTDLYEDTDASESGDYASYLDYDESYGEVLSAFDCVKSVTVDISDLPEDALKCDSVKFIWNRNGEETSCAGIMLGASLAKEEGIEFDESELSEDTAIVVYGWNHLKYKGEILTDGIAESLTTENIRVTFDSDGTDRSEEVEAGCLEYEDGYVPGTINVTINNDIAPTYYVNAFFGSLDLTYEDTSLDILGGDLYEEKFFIYKD